MVAWVPIALAVASAYAKYKESESAGEDREQSFNNTSWREPADFYNWGFTPEQNEGNMGNIFFGDIMSMAQNLLRGDLGSLLTGGRDGKAFGAGGGKPSYRPKSSSKPRRDTYSA